MFWFPPKKEPQEIITMQGRRVVFLSMPIEALLEVLYGRATASLPKEVPPDVQVLYSYIDPEHQVLKIAVTHPKFDSKKAEEYIKTHKIETKVVEPEKPEQPEGYSGDSLIQSDDWHRLV